MRSACAFGGNYPKPCCLWLALVFNFVLLICPEALGAACLRGAFLIATKAWPGNVQRRLTGDCGDLAMALIFSRLRFERLGQRSANSANPDLDRLKATDAIRQHTTR